MRARLVEQEERLSRYAARSCSSAGRLRAEPDDPLRLPYQVDRDRIIHSKAFRRMKHKTQVFIAPVGDHYRTRLTHTMEVMQVARSIARALNLNEDLAEAIALGHDLGHTPFGHAGEAALAAVLPGGFRHNEQSVRVVDALEKDGQGLNLSEEVRDGILKHSKLRESIEAEGWGIAETLEGQVVKIADSLAYLNHDIDDALRAGVLQPEQIPDEVTAAFGVTSGSRITAFVTDVVDYNWRVALGEGNGWRDAVGNGVAIGLSPAVLELVDALREFMFESVYLSALSRDSAQKARSVVHALFECFFKHPEKMPDEWSRQPHPESRERLVADYIAGMTDRYAVSLFEREFIPHSWLSFS